MNINVVYFASLRERLGLSEEQVEISGEVTVASLIDLLVEQHGDKWSEFLRESQVLVAVNQEMVERDQLLSGDDEVAFFPPVTGG